MTEFVNSFGYLGIFALIFIENVFPPIPSEVVLLFGGALTTATDLQVLGVVLFSTIGSVLGATVLYCVGSLLGVERIRTLFASPIGKAFGLKTEQVDIAGKWFHKYENKAVFICRCIPIVRSLISIPAGIAKMNVPVFLLLTAAGSAIWNTAIVCAGAVLGDAWGTALPYIERYSLAAAAAIVLLAVLLFTVIKLKRK